MVSRPEKSTWAVQKTARPVGKPAPRAGSLEARRQSKAREKASREEANGQPSGKKSHGSPKDRPAGAKTSAARRRLVSRISGSAETVQGESKKQAARKQMASRPGKRPMADQERARPARKSAPRAGDWSAAREKDHWQTKKEPGRRENQRREEANGQPPGKKTTGRPRKSPAGGNTSAARKQMASRLGKRPLAVQENARPAGKPAPRTGDWSAGFLEARKWKVCLTILQK